MVKSYISGCLSVNKMLFVTYKYQTYQYLILRVMTEQSLLGSELHVQLKLCIVL